MAMPAASVVPEATVQTAQAGTEVKSVTDPSVAAVPFVSPQKRLVALLLAWPTPFPAGLHRVYVGKTGTGILWFFTCGMFLIGQIVDFILILAGRFQDKEGRPVHYWTKPKPGQEVIPMYGRTATALPVSPIGGTSVLAGFLAFVGYLALIGAILIGLLLALRLPWLVAAGIPDPHLEDEIERYFGYAGWPSLVERIGWIVWAILLLFSTTFVVVARRRHGAGHIIRAVIGMTLMAAFLVCLYEALPIGDFYLSPSFKSQVDAGQIGPMLDESLKAVDVPFVIGAVGAFALAITTLSWPAQGHRPQRAVAEYNRVMT